MTNPQPKKKRGGNGTAAAAKTHDDTLSQLLAKVTSKVNARLRLDPNFDARFDELGAAIKERTREEVVKPIDRGNFEFLLDLIRSAYKHADFTDELREAGGNLYRYVLVNQMRMKPEFFKASTLAYELHDNLYIDRDINDWAADDGKKVFQQLQERLTARDADATLQKRERELLREKILWCTCYGNELKRHGNTDEALRVFKALYRFTSERVMNDEMPCYATRAIISYHLGSVFRLKEDHEQAELMYMRAVELYFERSRRRPGQLEEFFFSTRRVAMCIGLGIGWVNLTRGYLRRAENALATARSLMVHINDPVVGYYIDMLWGTIRRCRAGSDTTKLAQAVEALREAREFFKRRKHPRYESRACWELALAYNRLGDYDESEKHLKYVESHSDESNNAKWKTNVHVLRSRNLRDRGEYEESLIEAEAACTSAKLSGIILPLADAYITRGEVKFVRADETKQEVSAYLEAQDDFEAALKELQPPDSEEIERTLNPKITAVCLLRILQCHVRTNRWQGANECLEKWMLLRHQVEHEWVHELALKATLEFKAMTEDFTVSARDASQWNLDEKWDELQMWLIFQALRHTGNNRKEAAKLLGFTSTRLGQILRDHFQKENDAEVSSKGRERPRRGNS